MKCLSLLLFLFAVSPVSAKPASDLLVVSYPGSTVVIQHSNEFVAVDFPMSLNSYEIPESWELERLEGENSVSIYNVPLSVTNSTLKIFRSIENELKRMGVEGFISCSAAQGACGYYFPRRLALVEPRKSYYDEMSGFWNYNIGDFYVYTGVLSKEDSKFYISVVVALSDSMKHIQYSVDITEVALEAPETQALTVEKISKSISETGSVVLDGLFFETDKAQIKDSSKASLAAAGQYLKNNPEKKYLVVGHTDSVGSDQYNQKLSEERAEAVIKNLRTSFDLSAVTLESEGKGLSSPVASNGNKAGRELNRRVEIVLISMAE